MISVITPCLNIISGGREEFFRKMMESVHQQTYRDIEHVVVHGYSSDGTADIIDEYVKKGWVSVLLKEKKKGIYPAMNAGIKLARGEYVSVMNTDDYFLNLDYFNRAVQVIHKGEFDFVHADRIIKSRVGEPDLVKKGNERVAYFRMPFRHQTMIVKKSVFNQIGFFDESYEICADYAWVLKLLAAKKRGSHFDEIVLCSLGGGASSNRQKCIKEATRVLHESYGRMAGLSYNECRDIYLQNISDELFAKIESRIDDQRIVGSLRYCRDLSKNII